MDTGTEAAGLLGRARRWARLFGGLIQARTRLFLVELQEERLRLISVLLLAMSCVWCTGMSLMLLTFLVAALSWEEHRVLVLVLLTLAWAAGAALLLWSLCRRLREWRPFAATRDQFKKDVEWFGPGN